MDYPQQQAFRNLSKNTVYYSKSKVIAQKHEMFPKYRYQQLQNQFELVDLHNNGKLTQKQIITYLHDKYEWVNEFIMKDLFNSMKWDANEAVTKEQFVSKYLERERKLYNQINGLNNYGNWVKTLQDIYKNQLKIGIPRLYFYTQIRKVQILYENKTVEWTNLVISYEDHETHINYQFEEAQHFADYPSFQIWLPARGDSFFLKLKFKDVHDNSYIYGQTYLSIPLDGQVSKMSNLDLPITKDGKNVGYCIIFAYAQADMNKVKEQLELIKSKQIGYIKLAQDKQKQYEYLQFLWGVRHRTPHKIQPLDIKWRLMCRMLLIIAIGVIGVTVHILGRCQPLSIIIMFLMLRTWEFVYLRPQKFLLTWLTVCGILLDIIWIALSSGSLNQINFFEVSSALIMTYVLLGVKGILLTYLLLAEKSLISD